MDFFGYFNITPSISSADNKPSSYDSYTGLASVNTATAKDNGFVFSFAIDKSIVGDKKSVYFLSVLTFKLKDSGQATNAYNARNNNALNLKASLFAEC